MCADEAVKSGGGDGDEKKGESSRPGPKSEPEYGVLDMDQNQSVKLCFREGEGLQVLPEDVGQGEGTQN